jgi:hypothetical protein
MLRDMNKVFDLSNELEDYLFSQVWELGTKIMVKELYAVEEDLNSFKELYKKYKYLEEHLHM